MIGGCALFIGSHINCFSCTFPTNKVLYSALLHLPPLRFHCADGWWDRTQDRCNLQLMHWQSDALTTKLDFIRTKYNNSICSKHLSSFPLCPDAGGSCLPRTPHLLLAACGRCSTPPPLPAPSSPSGRPPPPPTPLRGSA